MNSIEPPPLIPNPASAGAPLPHMSLPARLLNIFAIPGEVFRDVKAAPRSLANWLVPVVLA
ncbi:MAG TPA: hypothetical protein VK327_15735, partial [Candidatus Paceibacterota bacterium]|nr:hypothetical protein [Candidatus Paceibacterota bacterium]